jgi:hypothetical protein
MNNLRIFGSRTAQVIFALMLAAFASIAGAASTGNPNPGVIPNHGPKYGELGAQWWQWAWSFPFAQIPYYQDGAVDISAHQSGHVWFLAGAGGPITPMRTGKVPSGTSLFLPLTNLINDYPCPPQFNFEPNPGETLEQFLIRTGNEALPHFTDLFAEIDGVRLKGLTSYRATSRMFTFTADPALVAVDPCVTGQPQQGVAVGYWLYLPPFPPGRHTLHFGTSSWGQDVFYDLTVTHGKK